MDDERPPVSARTRRRLAEMRRRPINFDADADGPFTPERGWRVEDLRRELPSEAPGPPVADASWQTARRLMCGYEFADPSIVRAAYDPDEPLAGRTMLLELRYLGLRVHVGVRVVDVYDRTCEREGETARVWGWNYRTLEGHLERGQMAWEVWKWMDSGRVEFHIHAFSRRAPLINPFVRLGFGMVGPRERRRFLRSTLERMNRITEAALRGESPPEAVSDVSRRSTARRSGGGETAHDDLAENIDA